MLVHRRRLGATTVYLINSGASSLFFGTIFVVNLVYQVEVAHLNPLQLVLVGTALETVCFFCQVPTGVLADVYSRRQAVVLGTFLAGAAFVLEGSFPRFDVILLSQMIWGLGATLSDGALEAWLAGEVGEEHIGRIFISGEQVGLIGWLFAAVAGVALGSIRLNLPILVGGSLAMLLAFFLALFMPERGFQQASAQERPSWRALGATLRGGVRDVRSRPVLLAILCIALFYGLWSEGFDRLGTAHFLADFTFPSLGALKPIVWFGIFTVGSTLLSIIGTEFVKRRLDTSSGRWLIRAQFVLDALMIVCLVAFGLAGNFFLALAAYWGVTVFRTISRPLYTTWLTQNTDAKSRATVLSMSGQLDALGQIAGGPGVGYIGTVVSLRAALVTAGLMLAPVLPLFAYAARRSKHMVIVREEDAREVKV
ncbi:MAG: MFS transporter [Chloroflexota bacterium]|nr:MFS transporter [Chloroflexota bacterium]